MFLDLVLGPLLNIVAVAFPLPLATVLVAYAVVVAALNDASASLEGAVVSVSGMLDLGCHPWRVDPVTGLDEDGAEEAFAHWSEQHCPAFRLADSATFPSSANNLLRNSAFEFLRCDRSPSHRSCRSLHLDEST